MTGEGFFSAATAPMMDQGSKNQGTELGVGGIGPGGKDYGSPAAHDNARHGPPGQEGQ